MNFTVYNQIKGKEETYEFASFGARLGARIIDVFIIIIPGLLIPLIPQWLYWSLQQSGEKQSTVGQKALGIKVLGVQGQKVTFGMATGRFFGNFLNVFTFFIGYFMFFFNNNKQCLHDYLSGCVVVKEKPIQTTNIAIENSNQPKELDFKSQELSGMLTGSYQLPYFGQLPLNNLEENYKSNINLNNEEISTDLNFESKAISNNDVGEIDFFLKNIKDFDLRNKNYIEEDFGKDGESKAYIQFFMEELSLNELQQFIDFGNQNISKSKQLLNKLKLVRVGLYPDKKDLSYFATFDYTFEFDGKPSNQVLVVNTDKNGNLDHITWES